MKIWLILTQKVRTHYPALGMFESQTWFLLENAKLEDWNWDKCQSRWTTPLWIACEIATDVWSIPPSFFWIVCSSRAGLVALPRSHRVLSVLLGTVSCQKWCLWPCSQDFSVLARQHCWTTFWNPQTMVWNSPSLRMNLARLGWMKTSSRRTLRSKSSRWVGSPKIDVIWFCVPFGNVFGVLCRQKNNSVVCIVNHVVFSIFWKWGG